MHTRARVDEIVIVGNAMKEVMAEDVSEDVNVDVEVVVDEVMVEDVEDEQVGEIDTAAQVEANKSKKASKDSSRCFQKRK